MPGLRREDRVFILDLGEGENRLSPGLIKEVHVLLDEVTAQPGPVALVTTGGGEYFSNGVDLEWLGEHSGELATYTTEIHELLARLLALPIPTMAAVNGHVLGTGAMLALAHDFRVMRADQATFCFPEADVNTPFTPGMAALIQAKLTPAAAIASMTTARRFDGPQSRELGLVDGIADGAGLLQTAVDWVGPLADKDRPTLGAIKSTMFAAALAALRDTGETGQL
jgi:enoyl-CoA hydratase/carnithine racemase